MIIDLKQSFLFGSFLMFAGLAGCSVTATTGGATSDTCTSDGNVSGCSGGATGYSCSGSDRPEDNIAGLSCSSAVFGNGGALLYCCITPGFATNTCAQDSTVSGCITPSIGFSCAAGSSPPQQLDTSLTCSSGVAGTGGSTVYCCDTGGSAPVTTACASDSNVSCTAGGSGYTCPSSVMPDASLGCGAGITETNGETGYCCNAGGTTPTACTADSNVSCTGSTGYSCPSGVTPDSSLSCGASVAETNGEMGYCCTATTTGTATCTTNASVSCLSGTTGYSCTGTDTPWQATPTLICETTTVNGTTGYCCVTSANTCTQAPAITDCPTGAFGVACSGTDVAMGASPALICGSDPSGDAYNFCCTTN